LPKKLSLTLDLRDRKVLLIGCGKVGARKLSYLLGTGAILTVVEPYPSDSLLCLRDAGELSLKSEFKESMLASSPIVFIATDEENSKEILELIRRRKDAGDGDFSPWVNVAYDPSLGNFSLPAVAEEGLMRLTVSTDGVSPALAAKAAGALIDNLKGYGEYLLVLRDLRPLVLGGDLSKEKRREILIALGENQEIPELLKEGRHKEAREIITKLISPLKLPEEWSP
jgi:precorrin-2 dehydrogenase/sirohydrochlorin ferrochelatase